MKPMVHRHRTTAKVLVVLAAAAGMTLAATPAMATEDNDDRLVAGKALDNDGQDLQEDEDNNGGEVEVTPPPTETPTEVPPAVVPDKPSETVTLMVGPNGVKVEPKAGVKTQPKAAVKPKAKATLPETGSSATGPILGSAAALLLAGGAAVVVRRARQTS